MQANHDSTYPFDLIPLDGSGELLPQLGSADVDDVAPPMQFMDLSSDAPLPTLPEQSQFRSRDSNAQDGIPESLASPTPSSSPSPTMTSSGLWLEGDVLMCGCPDCKAPMTIRTWLMIADCWNCGVSIELSEEQEREAQRLMERQQKQRAGANKTAQPNRKQAPKAATEAKAPPQVPVPERKVKSKVAGDAPARPEPRKPAPKKQRPAPPAEAKKSKTPPPPPPAGKRPRGKTDPKSPAKPGDGPKQRFKGDPQGRGKGRPERKVHPAQKPGERAQSGKRRRPGQPMTGARAHIRTLAKQNPAHLFVRNLFRDTPAWLISLMFHLILVTFLALFIIPVEEDPKLITLSATVSKDVREGGNRVKIDPNNELKFDLPIPSNLDPNDQNVREALIKANQDAKDLRLDADSVNVPMPNLDAVKSRITKHGAPGSAIAARDPRVRVDMVQKEGGTTLTEAAVARGLRFLASQQQSDGRWKLDGGIRSDSAATSLALLPYLGAGQTHLVGKYRKTVSGGLRWLVDNQKPNGDLRANSAGNAGMYAHGQGAIVLCEAYCSSGDDNLRIPAQKAIDFVIATQYSDGGWRYDTKGNSGDTSVVGWQLMALQSAKAAGLEVDQRALEGAQRFLDSVTDQDQAMYAYQRGRRPTPTMTAEALLCRMYLGWKKDNPGLMLGARELIDNHLPDARHPNIYYWYYGTQVFHHLGGEDWEKWNQRMRDILVDTQEKGGRMAGSWPVRGEHSQGGGRIYMTSLAVCTLEVYYRHLPIFRQIDLD